MTAVPPTQPPTQQNQTPNGFFAGIRHARSARTSNGSHRGRLGVWVGNHPIKALFAAGVAVVVGFGIASDGEPIVNKPDPLSAPTAAQAKFLMDCDPDGTISISDKQLGNGRPGASELGRLQKERDCIYVAGQDTPYRTTRDTVVIVQDGRPAP